MTIMRIFVYGTLMSGFDNWDSLMRTADLIGPARTVPAFTMYSTTSSFPMVMRGGTTAILGELYEVGIETLERLDRLEGHPHWYRRELVQLADGTNASMYLIQEKPSWPIVIDGDWKKYVGGAL